MPSKDRNNSRSTFLCPLEPVAGTEDREVGNFTAGRHPGLLEESLLPSFDTVGPRLDHRILEFILTAETGFRTPRRTQVLNLGCLNRLNQAQPVATIYSTSSAHRRPRIS